MSEKAIACGNCKKLLTDYGYDLSGTKEQARSKYKKDALAYHPDKHVTEEAKAVAKDKFTDITSCYDMIFKNEECKEDDHPKKATMTCKEAGDIIKRKLGWSRMPREDLNNLYSELKRGTSSGSDEEIRTFVEAWYIWQEKHCTEESLQPEFNTCDEAYDFLCPFFFFNKGECDREALFRGDFASEFVDLLHAASERTKERLKAALKRIRNCEVHKHEHTSKPKPQQKPKPSSRSSRSEKPKPKPKPSRSEKTKPKPEPRQRPRRESRSQSKPKPSRRSSSAKRKPRSQAKSGRVDASFKVVELKEKCKELGLKSCWKLRKQELITKINAAL